MKTKTETLRGRVLRATLSFALAAGLIPVVSLANIQTAEAIEDSQAIEAVDVQTDTDSTYAKDLASSENTTDEAETSLSTSQATDVSDISPESSSSDESSSAKDTQSNASSAGVQTNTDAKLTTSVSGTPSKPEAEEILNLTLDLSQDNINTTINYNGLVYAINAEDMTTVSLVGWTGAAPKGKIAIPTEVKTANEIYSVTRISLAGNTSSTLDNIYVADLFDDSAKAYSVESIEIPASVTDIDLAFFQLFPNLKNIEVTKGNTNFTSFNGILFDSTLANLLLVPEG